LRTYLVGRDSLIEAAFRGVLLAFSLVFRPGTA